jgi:hypothetical protein
MFHIAAGEKLHADKFSSTVAEDRRRRRISHVNYTPAKHHKSFGAIVRSVAKLAGINLQKFGSFSYWFDKSWFHN